jgi:hypothetical protein
VRIRVVEEAVGAEAEVVRTVRRLPGEVRRDVGDVAVQRHALQAAGERLGCHPDALVPERDAAVIGDVERAVGAERGAVRPAAGGGDPAHGALVQQRDALPADLRERDALGAEPDRTFGKPEPAGEHLVGHAPV